MGASAGAGEQISLLSLNFLFHHESYYSTWLSGFHVYISIADCDFSKDDLIPLSNKLSLAISKQQLNIQYCTILDC